MQTSRRSLKLALVALSLWLTPLASAQTITILFPQEPGSLLPHFDLLSLAHEAQNLVYDRLFVIDEQGAYQPQLAAEVPTIANGGLSEDGTTYTIRLREGLTWQDGAPLTSEDIVFTWQVITDPDLPIPTRTVWQDIASIETPDALTAVITFPAPNVSFLGAASFAGAYILPSHLLADTDLATSPFHRQPVGSGPFRLVDWQSASHLRFERNDDYWAGPAWAQEVIIRIVAGSEAQRALIERGEADLVLQLGLTELPFLEGVSHFEAVQVPTFANWQIWLNNEDPVLSERAVRQALAHALDRELITEALLFGLGEAHDSPALPPSHWAHNPDVRAYPYDPAEAERILEDAGWVRGAGGVRSKDGQPLRVELINIAGQADRVQIIQAIQSFWNAVGADTVIREIDAASFPPTLGAGDYQAAYGSFGEQQEPAWNLWLGTNWQRYQSDEAFDLLRLYNVTIDQEERGRIAREFQAVLGEDLPLIPVASRPLLAAKSTGLVGYSPTVTSSLWNVATWSK
ncbi:MAG: peptide ABC transporter substrate-binding protein [Trueperaceae bacterium]|nr:peptide ABC transporter substrate-binding protein [Trueperaceae bacterium]